MTTTAEKNYRLSSKPPHRVCGSEAGTFGDIFRRLGLLSGIGVAHVGRQIYPIPMVVANSIDERKGSKP